MARHALLTLLLTLLLALPALAADSLEEARRLSDAGKVEEAVAMLTRLSQAPDAGAEVFMELGSGYFQLSMVTSDGEQARTFRLQAREAVLKAQALGSQDPLLQVMLDGLPADGSDPRLFSRVPGADAAMRKGEQAFAKDDMAGARGFYEEALRLDPTLYLAALFLGDTWIAQKDFARAIQWYSKAVELDPSVETAYRYWGNALLRSGRAPEARQKYLQAVLRDPYSRLVWQNGLGFWAESTGTDLTMPRVDPPVKVSGNEIGIDPQADPAWLAYAMTRTLWRNEKFAKAHPGETYRRSLAEEAEALAAAADVAVETGGAKDDDLVLLVGLKQQGLLEPFVLFSRVDAEISQDYPGYFQGHEAQLLDFLDRYVAPAR